MSLTAAGLAALIREKIGSGEWPEGKRLPSITEIAAEYNIGRGAAQQAMATLRAEGVITSRHGSGHYVQRRFARISRVSPRRLAAASGSIQDQDTGPRPRDEQVEVDEVPAPDFVAESLGIKAGEPVVRRSRVYVVEARPVQFAVSYFPVDLARGTAIVYRDTGAGGVYGRLAERGWKPERFRERLIARPPLPDEARRLDMVRNLAMVLEITRTAWAGERCVEVNRMVLDAEAYEVIYDFSA